MNMNEINRIPIHPGEVLKEELESRGISQKRYSELTGVSYTMLNEILNGKRSVTTLSFFLIVVSSFFVTVISYLCQLFHCIVFGLREQTCVVSYHVAF